MPSNPVFGALRAEAYNLYLTMRDTRSVRAVQEHIAKNAEPGQRVPSYKTVSRWSTMDSWTARVADYEHRVDEQTAKAALVRDVHKRIHVSTVCRQIGLEGLEHLRKNMKEVVIDTPAAFRVMVAAICMLLRESDAMEGMKPVIENDAEVDKSEGVLPPDLMPEPTEAESKIDLMLREFDDKISVQ
jgi:hypothetical protein